MTDLTSDLTLGLTLADTADRITLARAGATDLRVDRKPDRTPVTDADLAVEDAIRVVLRAQRPQDAVLGEERGGPAAAADRVWLLDPIDGTKNFLRGLPIWATLIALVQGGRPVVGVISAPGFEAAFEVDPFTRECLLNGWDEVALTLRHQDQISAYEVRAGRR